MSLMGCVSVSEVGLAGGGSAINGAPHQVFLHVELLQAFLLNLSVWNVLLEKRDKKLKVKRTGKFQQRNFRKIC